jgi:hypothetical protein
VDPVGQGRIHHVVKEGRDMVEELDELGELSPERYGGVSVTSLDSTVNDRLVKDPTAVPRTGSISNARSSEIRRFLLQHRS